MKKIWAWDKNVRRYRDERGRFLSAAALSQLRDMYLDRAMNKVTRMVSAYADDGDLPAFRSGMRELIRAVHVDMYAAGAGGWAQMTPGDWGAVGAYIKGEYKYLDNFIADIAAGNVSIARMLWRAKLYVDAGTPMFERGKAKTFGLTLPEYPGDGNQICLRSCRCHWEITEFDSYFRATWVLEPTAKHCDSCLDNSEKWSPLIIKKKNGKG